MILTLLGHKKWPYFWQFWIFMLILLQLLVSVFDVYISPIILSIWVVTNGHFGPFMAIIYHFWPFLVIL